LTVICFLGIFEIQLYRGPKNILIAYTAVLFHFMKRLLFLMSLVFMVAAVKAQSIYDYDFDLDLYGKGARAAGMAYAFNAVADDATALSWNPAGIIQIKKPEIAFSNSIINTEYRHSIYEYDYKPVYLFEEPSFLETVIRTR
jgi:hypothetical protein